MTPDSARSPRITAAAGTELAGAFSEVPSLLGKTEALVPSNSSLHPQGLHPTRGVAASDFRPLAIFLTAASRRSLGRISVPVWLIILSDQLSIVALVGHYPTNKLMERRVIPWR